MLSLYRISDFAQTSAHKPKLPHATKRHCLEQFISVFGKDSLIVIADSVSDDTYDELKEIMGEHAQNVIRTTYKSGAYSFLAAVKLAISADIPDDTPVYLCEDDYLHTSNAKTVLLEGIEIADYVTGYDHPDKYIQYNIKPTRVYHTQSLHWREAESTTMTFMTRVKTLRDDYEIYQKYCNTGYPYDHEMFLDLESRGRKLITSIPAVSTHTELAWLAPITKWL